MIRLEKISMIGYFVVMALTYVMLTSFFERDTKHENGEASNNIAFNE